jgi:hypothetical protein
VISVEVRQRYPADIEDANDVVLTLREAIAAANETSD